MFDWHVENLIREAEERGDFDDLPGKGKPLPDLDKPRDELWWVKKWIERENLHFLPEARALKLDLDRQMEELMHLRDESEVRRRVRALNAVIKKSSVQGVPPMSPLNPDTTVRQWRLRRRLKRA